LTAILRAIAEKLIPGIPYLTRIAILQQTGVSASANSQASGSLEQASAPQASLSRTVLEEVIEKAISKDEVQKEIDGKSQS
jgi:hypothetical protein